MDRSIYRIIEQLARFVSGMIYFLGYSFFFPSLFLNRIYSWYLLKFHQLLYLYWVHRHFRFFVCLLIASLVHIDNIRGVSFSSQRWLPLMFVQMVANETSFRLISFALLWCFDLFHLALVQHWYDFQLIGRAAFPKTLFVVYYTCGWKLFSDWKHTAVMTWGFININISITTTTINIKYGFQS